MEDGASATPDTPRPPHAHSHQRPQTHARYPLRHGKIDHRKSAAHRLTRHGSQTGHTHTYGCNLCGSPAPHARRSVRAPRCCPWSIHVRLTSHNWSSRTQGPATASPRPPPPLSPGPVPVNWPALEARACAFSRRPQCWWWWSKWPIRHRLRKVTRMHSRYGRRSYSTPCLAKSCWTRSETLGWLYCGIEGKRWCSIWKLR